MKSRTRTRTDFFLLGFCCSDNCLEKKYEGTNGVAASVELWHVPLPPSPDNKNTNLTKTNSTDELFKSSAYLTEAYGLNAETKCSTQPTETPFNVTFWWLEVVGAGCGDEQGGESSLGEGKDDVGKGRRGRRRVCGLRVRVERQVFMLMWVEGETSSEFGKAISGSYAWDPPGGPLNGLSPFPQKK
jgi:hypothetical protein